MVADQLFQVTSYYKYCCTVGAVACRGSLSEQNDYGYLGLKEFGEVLVPRKASKALILRLTCLWSCRSAVSSESPGDKRAMDRAMLGDTMRDKIRNMEIRKRKSASWSGNGQFLEGLMATGPEK